MAVEQVTVRDGNARDMLDFLVQCTELLRSRRNRNPPPILTVEQAAGLSTERLGELMDTAASALRAMGLAYVDLDCDRITPPGTSAIIREIITTGRLERWPRSRLLASIEQTRRQSVEEPRRPETGEDAWRRWYQRRGVRSHLRDNPPLWSALTTLVGLAPIVAAWFAATSLNVALVVLLVLAYVGAAFTAWAPAITIPLIARFGAGSGYRWLASSIFIGVRICDDGGGQNPDRPEPCGFNRRLERLWRATGDDRQGRALWRLIEVYGLREDLRRNHRTWSIGLRGWKRAYPPVLMLRNARTDNGGIPLIKMLSDIRSQQSEVDPLLVIASVTADGVQELDQRLAVATAVAEQGARRNLLGAYEMWRSTWLPLNQAPSRREGLPWVVRWEVGSAADVDGAKAVPVWTRPWWSWLWSLPCAALVVVGVVCAGVIYVGQIDRAYCAHHDLFWGEPGGRWAYQGNTRECIGVSDGALQFGAFQDGGVRKSLGLDEGLYAPSDKNTGGQVTLVDLENRIMRENAAILHDKQPYVTVVYAGPLTSPVDAETGEVVRRTIHDPLGAIKELAGVYLAQTYINDDVQGGLLQELKLRVLFANGGDAMAHQDTMTARIIDQARRDPTILAVVGLGRDNAHTDDAVRRLNRAGLMVIGTVDSSDRLPALPGYFGMSATDQDEAAAMMQPASGIPTKARSAVVVYRTDGDEFSSELRSDVAIALRGKGFTVKSAAYANPGDVDATVHALCASRPSLIYFAGRTEDLKPFAAALRGAPGDCYQPKARFIGGDDLTKADFGSAQLPADLDVYYTAFVWRPDVAPTAQHVRPFFSTARDVLRIDTTGADTTRTAFPLLDDGHMMLGFDAAAIVAKASYDAYKGLGRPQEPGAVDRMAMATVLAHEQLADAASGKVDLSLDTHQPGRSTNRAYTLLHVVRRPDGGIRLDRVCGRRAGELVDDCGS